MTDAEDRRAFREFVLRHHPDRGGDPETFTAGLAAWQARQQPAPAPASVVFHRRRRGLARLVLRARRRRARRDHPRVH